MKVLFILPDLTMAKPGRANIFLNACLIEVEKYLLEVSVIRNLNQVSAAKSTINKNTLLIVFNNNVDNYSDEILNMISDAKGKGANIWPVAMKQDCRKPMHDIDIKQSYEVYEQLRCRNLNDDYLKTIGTVFARKIISGILPTFYSDNCLLFVSHRRLDGEEIAAKFCDQLDIQARNNRSFRDLTSVEVGEEAQKIIDSALGQSDVLIFIHTEKSAESDWIKKELIHAILNNVPIIWVRVDEADKAKLSIKPGDNPHIECTSEDFDKQDKIIEIVDAVLEKSFELIMLNSNSVYDQINTFKEFCESSNLELIEEDKRRLIYYLAVPRKGYTYPQRQINQYIQYFGRRYKEDDLVQMIKFIEDKKHNGHKIYDSAVLLSNKVKVREINQDIVQENYGDFYSSWQEYTNGNKSVYDNEIIISGSFPSCDEIYKQSLYDAVNIFSKEFLKNGFTLTFGSHPTFQDIIFEIGKKFRPDDYQKAIKMFISSYFKDKYDIAALKLNSTVVETDDIEHNLLKSLTEMRLKMINRKTVKALICLGGVIRDGDTTQGIDEEIKIARANNIPIFIVGSVGGRSSQLAAEKVKTGVWIEFNNESKEFNESLALNLDYRNMADKIINVIRNN